MVKKIKSIWLGARMENVYAMEEMLIVSETKWTQRLLNSAISFT